MTQSTHTCPVLEVAPADSASALAHFSGLLRFETDCWDVHASLAQAGRGFVLLDVRSPGAYAAGHVPGAVSLPYHRITESSMAMSPAETTFVVYCTGPHCNGADKAAVRLARLGLPVKKMIGGFEGWKDEGFELVHTRDEENSRETDPRCLREFLAASRAHGLRARAANAS